MGQKLGADVIPTPTRVSGTSVQNTGTQRVTVGGQQYVSTSTLTINTATTGAGGLDTGALSTNQLWYIHYVISGGVLALIASLSKTAPTGFTTNFAWSGYAFTTDNASAVLGVGTLQGLVIIRTLLSGSGNYTPNTGCTRLDIEAVGGGGGGSASGTNAANPAQNGGTGGTTTFGSSLITCNGGTGGFGGIQGPGGPGGSATISLPAFGLALTGGKGGGAAYYNTGVAPGNYGGGSGAPSAWGGGIGPTEPNAAGDTPPNNTGSGGGAASGNLTSNQRAGGGGGAGGWAKATILNPVGPYPYQIGTAGTPGSPGTSGSAGGTGGSGGLEVRESFA